MEDYYLSVDADTIDPRWCVRFPVVTVVINIEITLTAQTTIVRNQQAVLLNYGHPSTSPLDIMAGPQNDTLQLHAIQPQRELTFQGGEGLDTLSFDQADGALDFSAGLVKTDSIEVLALANGSAQTVQLPADLPLLNLGLNKELMITADIQDKLVFDRAWNLQAPIWNSQGFAHRLNNLKKFDFHKELNNLDQPPQHKRRQCRWPDHSHGCVIDYQLNQSETDTKIAHQSNGHCQLGLFGSQSICQY